MHALDLAILIILLLAAVRGVIVGAASQLLSLLGTFVGLSVGVALVLLVDPHITSSVEKTVVAVVLLVAPAALLGKLARFLGRRAGHALRRVHLGVVDSVGGAAVGVAGALVSCWLLASVFVNSSIVGLSQAVTQSAILRQVDRVMPPVPDAFSAVETYLTKSGFPSVLINVLPQSPLPVQLPALGRLQAVVAQAEPSTVKVVAIGCGGEEEGSGFVTSGGLVVTNAHVVAGSQDITVDPLGEAPLRAIPLLFDPDLDLALLRVGSTDVPELSLSRLYASRGDAAVVLGYPGGGPFTPKPAGILQRFDAQGRDIYNAGVTTRVVYEVEAIVRPGNSGGPLVSKSGLVIGVVFSRSSTDPSIGYALASPAIAADVQDTLGSSTAVATGHCIG